MMNMQRYPVTPPPFTLSHEHSDVDTMESDSCQSSADAGDSQETGSVGDEAVAKGGDDDDGDDDAEILVATKSSGKRRMVMASDSKQKKEDCPVVDDGEDGDSTRASGEGEVGDNSHASGDREDGGTLASDDSDAEPVMSDRLRQLLAKSASNKDKEDLENWWRKSQKTRRSAEFARRNAAYCSRIGS